MLEIEESLKRNLVLRFHVPQRFLPRIPRRDDQQPDQDYEAHPVVSDGLARVQNGVQVVTEIVAAGEQQEREKPRRTAPEAPGLVPRLFLLPQSRAQDENLPPPQNEQQEEEHCP